MILGVLEKTILESSEDGVKWRECPLAGDAWHCGHCGVGVLSAESRKCPNCLAAVRAVDAQ